MKFLKKSKYFTERSKTDKSRKGSVAIESAIVIPFILAALLFIIFLLRTFTLYNVVSNALYKSVDKAAKYAVVYHKNGVEALTNAVRDQLSDKLDLGVLPRYADDVLYMALFNTMFKAELSADPTYNRLFKDSVHWEFIGSTFFNGNDEIYIKSRFHYRTPIPLLEKLISGFTFEKNLRVRAVINGVPPEINETEQESDSIWSLPQLKRGVLLHEKFGGNLPGFFPVIDTFSNGKAVAIRSVDHTKDSYKNDKKFYYQLDHELKRLVNFTGGTKSGVTVTEEEIMSRELIFVFPEDEMSSGQQDMVNKIISKAAGQGVEVKIERYQYTQKSGQED